MRRARPARQAAVWRQDVAVHGSNQHQRREEISELQSPLPAADPGALAAGGSGCALQLHCPKLIAVL
jgi:hypothetical protein